MNEHPIFTTRWRGIPVSLDRTVLLILPVAFLFYRNLPGLLIFSAAYLGLIIAHEIGHAYIARRRGLHVESIDVFAVHGRCVYEPQYSEDEIWVSWGGVAAQALLLAIALTAAIVLGPAPDHIAPYIAPLADVLIFSNILIIIFNLLPHPALDGGKAWRVFSLLGSGIVSRSRAKAAAKQAASKRAAEIMTRDVLRRAKEASEKSE